MIRIFQDLESLSRGAAELLALRSRSAIRERGRFAVVLAGGGTPRKTYEILARPPYRDEIDWGCVHVFWGDERCVPPDHSLSNARMARNALLDVVPVLPSQVHPILCAEEPQKAAREYEMHIRSFFQGKPPRFDMVLLGLGENGHTASLFPGSPVLEEGIRWACEAYVTEQKMWRVTLTPPLINRAELVVFLVSGTSKAGVLREVLEESGDALQLPARLIQPERHGGTLVWLLDREAAGSLKGISTGKVS